jgi:HEAT repeat protein
VVASQPTGAAGVLLAYLPSADAEIIAREVEEALVAVTRSDGRTDPALLAGLADPAPVRRAAAASAICRAGGSEGFTAVRALLKDSSPAVRHRAALGLAAHNDAEAVPVLIDQLADAVPGRRKEAEGCLTGLAGEWAVATPQGDDGVSIRLRREAWLTWWRTVDGPALLEEVRGRTLTDAELERARGLIAQLDNSGSTEALDKVTGALLEMGDRVVPLLRRAASREGRTAQLAARCLEDMDGAPSRPLPAAAGRLLALRRPAGSLETLLAYLPCADSDEAEAGLAALLPDLGIHDGKPDPALVAALGDKVAVRRAAAAEALCSGKAVEHFPAVRKLLTDSDADVRLRSAVALSAIHDKEAIPTLIDLLATHPSVARATDVEDILLRLAGENAPNVAVSAGASDRGKARDAWIAWWTARGADVDLARLETTPRQFGRFLAVEMWNPVRGSGRVAELDRAGKVYWQVSNLQGPQDVQYLTGDHILVAEQNANRVTERDLLGKVLWEQSVQMPFQCQRLRNGNTFIAGRNVLMEVDRWGRVVFNLHRPDYLISARRFRDGQMAFVTMQGTYVRLDASGKEVKSVRLPFARLAGHSAAEILPGDRVLVSVEGLNKVTEYDANGKATWEATVTRPGNPTRLSNGHTLVVNGNEGRATELSRSGTVVDEWSNLPVHLWRVEWR